MIFKLQLPLASNEDAPPALLYNEDRSILHFVPVTPEVKELFADGEYKIYIKGRLKRGTVLIDEIVGEQEW